MTQTRLPQSSQDFEPELIDVIKGQQQPRIYTKPLVVGPPGPCGCGCALTPETSYGFEVIEFAEEVMGVKLLPWQKWLLIHIAELRPDGLPRFKEVLILVARQNGKTFLLNILTLYWLFVEQVELVMGMSTNLDTAKEAWKHACQKVLASDYLRSLINPKKDIKSGAGAEVLQVPTGEYTYSRYKIAASNAKGGRGFTIDRLIMDELRDQKDWSAYDAATPATAAVEDSQIIHITNQGPEDSVVLHALHEAALQFLEDGTGDDTFGLFEWSAPPELPIDDPNTWAYSNPSLGYTVKHDKLKGKAGRAAEAGGQQEASFRTEYLCQRVLSLDAAIDPIRWAKCLDKDPGHELATLDKSSLHYFLDISVSRQHATLIAAALVDGKIRVEVVHEWRDTAMRNFIPTLRTQIKKHGIKHLGYLPIGPVKDYFASLKSLRIPGLKLVMLEQTAVTAACMGFASDVFNGHISHHSIVSPKEGEKVREEVLTNHVIAAERKSIGESEWRFTRKNVGNCDAAFAAAGAVYLAKAQPEPLKPTVFSVKPKERS